MPTYQFLDTETGEEFESFMKISERETFLSENPHIQTVVSAAAIVGGVSIKDKVPDGFKEVLSKISENHKGSNVAERYGRKSIKEAKTSEVVKKHVDRVSKRTSQ
jgi:predicted nucleic acid-binding Zn ribbon protein